jgi:hypothetical protein
MRKEYAEQWLKCLKPWGEAMSKPRLSVRRLALRIEQGLVNLGLAEDDRQPVSLEALVLQIDVFQMWLKTALASVGQGRNDAEYREHAAKHATEIALRSCLIVESLTGSGSVD